MRHLVQADRGEYEAAQITRSRAKFALCNVAAEDVVRYRRRFPDASGPVLCLGVRNGAELDHFRAVFSGWVIGVDINPGSANGRRDVVVGSFDSLPPAWSGAFGVVFSNSFDHAFDPAGTAAEWTRVLRPGGVLILAHAVGAGTPLSVTDCCELDSRAEVEVLFGLPIIHEDRGVYPELFLQKPRVGVEA